MDSRDEYLCMMRAKLEEWNSAIDTLIAKADEVTVDVKNEYNDQIKSLKIMLTAIRQKLEDIQQVGEIAWEIMKSALDLAWTSMEEAMESARSRFR